MFSTLTLLVSLSLASPADTHAPVTSLTLQDGGQIHLSTTGHDPKLETEIQLIRTDASGNSLWAQTYGGTGYELAGSVLQADNGDYLLLGSTSSYGKGNFDVFLLRLNAEGKVLWKQTYGEFFNDKGHAIRVLDNGQFEIQATRQMCNDNTFRTPCTVSPWVFVVDGDGNLLKDEKGDDAPVLSVMDAVVGLDLSGAATITPEVVGSATDDGGEVTLSVSPATFGREDVGVNVVTVTATDRSGNVTELYAIVDVYDPYSDLVPDVESLAPAGLLYPNPTAGAFTLAWQSESREAVQVQVISLMGRVQYEQTFLEGVINESILLENATPGIYLVSITQGDLRKVEQLIIR